MRLMLMIATLLPAAAAAQRPDIAPFVATQVAPGIHLLATPPDYLGPAIGNVTMIEQREGVVLVDSGATAGHGRSVAAFVRSVTPKPVRAVAITHWHNDHPMGVSEIRAAWPGVRIVSTARTRAGIAGPAATGVGPRPDERFATSILNQVSDAVAQYRLQQRDADDERRARFERLIAASWDFARSFRGTHYVLPDETFSRELLLDDPERPVRLLFLGRANTDGDAIAWLPRQRIVVTGDVVVAPTPFGFFSFPGDWLGVIERLKGLGFAILIPGHGEPQADAAYLDRLAATIADIRAQTGPLARQGLSLAEVRERVDFSAQTAIFGTTPTLRRTFEAFWLTPMVENAWREARGLPIVQGGGETTVESARRRRPAQR